MLSTLYLALAFLPFSLHLALAQNVDEIVILNKVLEVQIKHTIADVNRAVALNKTNPAAIVPADINVLAEIVEIAVNTTQNTARNPTTAQEIDVANSYVSLNDALLPLARTTLTNAASALTALGQESTIHTALFTLYDAYGDYIAALNNLLASDNDLITVINNSFQPAIGALFELLVLYGGF